MCRVFFGLALSPEAKLNDGEILSALETVLLSEKDSSTWPGTTLDGSTATVRTYRLPPHILPVLCSVQGLYSWMHPRLPEDLAFYLPNGENWLTSIAHERQAWITDPVLNADMLLQIVPRLEPVIHR